MLKFGKLFDLVK